MEAFIQFFETIPSAWRSGILASGILLFWILEGIVPLFRFDYGKARHAVLNLVFTVTTLIINLALAFGIVAAADVTSTHEFGLLYLVDLPLWLHVLLGVMLLDLIGAWLIHFIEHHVRWMWKFHLIHHTDTSVDVTTALRHHPGESIFRALFTILGVVVAGVPIGIVFVYQTFSALFSQFNHANIRMPDRVDDALARVFVTPNMHKVHHHYVQPLTDTNYGNIFSIWDRIFRTFVHRDPSTLTYGIDTHMQPEENTRLGNLMAIPFQPYRPPQGAKFADDAPDDSGSPTSPPPHSSSN